MGKLLLTGVDGNLGQLAADVLLTLEPDWRITYIRTSRKLNLLWL